jgi:hypothetical protein
VSKRGKGGAPAGNVNHADDPKFTLAMREAKALAKRNRSRRRRSRHDDAKAILAECGLSDSPLAKRLGVRLAQLDHEIDECERITNRIGRVKRDGSLSPVFERYLTLTQNDRAELVKLLDRLAELKAVTPGIAATLEDARRIGHELAAEWPEAFEYRVCLSDGTPFSMGGGNAAAPLAFDPLAGDAMALPDGGAAPEAARAVSGSLLPGHPLDRHETQPAPLPPSSPVTIDAESPLARAWRLGQAPDGSEYDD